MSHSPHLPPPSSSVRFYHKTRSVGSTLIIVVIASLAGMASALATEAWLLPTMIPEGGVYAFERNRQNGDTATLDPALVNRVEQRVVTIYDRREKIAGAHYPTQSVVGRAVFLSLDGWAVMHVDEFVSGTETLWDAMDYKGSVFSIDEAVVDPVAQLLYIKVKGEGFRVSSIAPWPQLPGTHVWAAHADTWYEAEVARSTMSPVTENQEFWRYRPVPHMVRAETPGTPLLSTTGELLGFAGQNGAVIPSFFITLQLNSLLENGKVAYEVLGWTGSILPMIQHPVTGQKISGLYITRPNTPGTASTVGRGDIVISMNGVAVDPTRVGDQILALPHEFIASVIRNGEIRDILVTKQNISL